MRNYIRKFVRLNRKISEEDRYQKQINKNKKTQEEKSGNVVVPILPYLLSFAAGAMIYVVVEELIPEAQEGEHSNIGTIGVALGFVIMMILDVALGQNSRSIGYYILTLNF